ncbi:MAG TPA: hypothetical protein VFT35_13910 [Gaiellaceae bacterium]|nr:hypothetical protein [Gaiellaceae bacterium]
MPHERGVRTDVASDEGRRALCHEQREFGDFLVGDAWFGHAAAADQAAPVAIID